LEIEKDSKTYLIKPFMKNRTLYFGDNLEILKKKIPDESFDLIYLDPPFNSNRSYNVLFKEGLQDSPAQVKAFEDSWHWTQDAKDTFDDLVTKSPESISNLMQAFDKMIGHNDMLAYLTMMTVRLVELRRVLKNTGSLYLHCDPTASHYLKIVLDAIFGKNNFQNEIVWHYKRWTATASRFQRMHDIIFYYTKTDNYIFTKPIQAYTSPEWIEDTVRGVVGGKLVRLKDETGQYIKRKKENIGVLMHDVWEDINFIAPTAKERLGYPTQKPEALLERIIEASSGHGDWVLDPFCGCGTTVAVSEKLKRNWVGIDVTALAINLIKRRLHDQFNLGTKQIYVDGLPTDLNGAKELFKKDPFEFEYWTLDLINARPAQSKTKENMRGPDRGIDGVITFHKNVVDEKWIYGRALVQIKGGTVHRDDIATLKSDVEREKADCGVFITLETPTKPMLQETIDAGTFEITWGSKFEFPKIQILTVEEILKGKQPNLPFGMTKNYHKEAKVVEDSDSDQRNTLF